MSLVEKKLKYINLTAQIRIRKWDASFTDGAPSSTRTSITYILAKFDSYMGWYD